MKKVVYANLFCHDIHYPLVDYLSNLSEQLKEEDKLILCLWDEKIYSFQHYRFGSLKEEHTVLIPKIKSILNYYKINYEIIYFSDAFFRLMKNEETSDLLYLILSKISIGFLEDSYKHEEYLSIRPMTISKVVFIIADYLVSLYVDKLFPELKINRVVYYYTGARFKSFIPRIKEVVSEKRIIRTLPSIIYWPAIPILNYESGDWISVGMSKEDVFKEIRKNYTKHVELKEIKDLLLITSKIIPKDSFLLCEDGKCEKLHLVEVLEKINSLTKEDMLMTLTENLCVYLEFVKNNMLNVDNPQLKKTHYIKNDIDFKKIVSLLNPAKLEIIKLCNGKRTINEIVKKSNLKPSSTRSYLSHLRAKNLISKDEKPKRRIDEILISFY